MRKRENHGMSTDTAYRCWVSMKQRCYNKNHIAYSRYGGRGIRVCDEWIHSFTKFLSDMGERPDTKHSIERICNDKGYSPDNCYWGDGIVQGLNTKQTEVIYLWGTAYSTTQACKILNISSGMVNHWKNKKGLSLEDSFIKTLERKYNNV